MGDELAIDIDLALQTIDSIPLQSKELDLYLDVLESYECWDPVFRILNPKLQKSSTREIKYYLRLARIYAQGMEDYDQVAKICQELVRTEKMPYQLFRDQCLVHIISNEDFELESRILEAISSALNTKEDKVANLERLCLIYEKKKFDEDRLNECNQELLEIDENNQKALRFFKAMYIQNHKWEEVTEILKRILSTSRHVNDKYRIAQELATVYLCQLDQPEEAIRVIDRDCKGSPLDTSSIQYEAYFQMKDWTGCLVVLHSYLSRIDGNSNKASIYLKIGELYELQGDLNSALEAFQQSHDLYPSILEPIESMIEIYLHLKDWPKVVSLLKKMQSMLDDDSLKGKLEEALIRIEGGLRGSRHV